MDNLNQTTKNLVNDLINALKYKSNTDENTVKTTKTASSLALLYEKARNAIEFRDEHLIRRAAIERIIKRRLFLNQKSENIAKLLIKELSWAKYFKEQEVAASKIATISKIIQKYKNIISTSNSKNSEILLGLCSCEIEENLVFNPLPQILINYVSSTITNHIRFDEDDLSMRNAQIYIAVERAFAKNDEILIRYKLLKSIEKDIEDPVKLIKALDKTEQYLEYPLKDILKRKIAQFVPPFNLIREIIREDNNFIKLIQEKESMEKTAHEVLQKKYSEAKDRLIRASKRSIIYIFLTKMVLAIIIEIPFEIIFGNINYLVLLINILFPPTLMYLFNLGIKLPSEKNTKLIINKLNDYFYKNEKEIIPEYVNTPSIVGAKNKFFIYIFIGTSSLVIFAILWLLNTLGFNLVSQLIFIFFLTVVSFFAFRVREISKDYQISDEYNESFWESLVDYIFLPIIKVGQFLSNQISKLNILSFIFDFIIEAPLKSFLEILEDWLHFVRTKKEEILS